MSYEKFVGLLKPRRLTGVPLILVLNPKPQHGPPDVGQYWFEVGLLLISNDYFRCSEYFYCPF